MLKVHYPRLMAGDAAAEARAKAFAERVHELTAFLVDVRGLAAVPGRYAGFKDEWYPQISATALTGRVRNSAPPLAGSAGRCSRPQHAGCT